MRPRVRFLLGCGALLLAYAGYTGYRLAAFARRAAPLQDIARRFPSRYTVGSGRPLSYVSLGDSTAFGVGASALEETLTYRVAASLASAGLEVRVENLAVSGARLADVVRAQLPRLPTGRLSLVTVSISANDATHGTDTGAFERDLGALLKELRARGVRTVVLTTTPNFRHTPAVPYPLRAVLMRRAERLAAIIRRVARREPYVRIADLYEEGTLASDQYAGDGFHPSAGGYRSWANIIRETLPKP